MKFWLIAYLFDINGDLQAKDIYEAATEQQCEQFAGEYARAHINTKLTMQLNCISDAEYNVEPRP